MSTTEHTPLPWKYNRTHRMSSDMWYVITDTDGYGPVVEVGGNDVKGQVAEAKHLVTNPATVEANAQLIVRAVNSHADMLEALELAYVALLKSGTSYRIHIQPELCACRHALANATGRTDEETQNHYEEVALKQQLATKGKL